ncbi:MAG: oxidoreductase family protein, partial [Novosphingobium sp.]
SIIEEFTPHYGRWCCGSGKNLTLVHSDFRLDNMLFDRDGTGVTLDWQTFSSGHPGRDTGLFIGCSLATEIRRQSEKAILAAYHQRMTALGVTNYSFEECFDDFRWGVFIGLQNVVIGMNAVQSTERGLKMFRQKLAKCCATIMDHDALQVLH